MNPSIALLGLGAIGSLMAFHWRELSPYAIQRDGTEAQRTLIDQDTIAHTLTLPAWQGEALDWLVVCTKAADSLPALEALAPKLGVVQRILLIQNGMGQQQQVADWLVQQTHQPELWVGSSTEGAYRQDNTTVVYAGVGQTVIGPWSRSLLTNNVDDAFNPHSSEPTLPHTQWVNNMPERLLHKLAVNAVINPLTAFYRCRNGELLNDAHRARHLQQLADEVATLYQCLSWSLPTPWLTHVENIARATANNRSSTLQDVLAQRPHELSYINGYLQSYARHHGIAMPIHDGLMAALHVKPLDLFAPKH